MINYVQKIKQAELGKTHLFYIGQAGFILKTPFGSLVAIDLYLSDCVEHLEGNIGYKRLLPPLLDSQELVFETVITTHAHYDHYDYDSVPGFLKTGKTNLFASYRCRDLVEGQNLDGKKITYVKPGDQFDLGEYSISFVECDHGAGAPDAFGAVIEVDGKRIYEAGDTCLRTDYAEKIRNMGKINVMIAPINGAFGNLNEKECATLSSIIRPDITIPCHYGMFAAHGGNPGTFISEMKKQCPNQNYLILTYGEQVTL